MAKSAKPGGTRDPLPAQRAKARRYAMQALYQWQLTANEVADIEAQFLADEDFRNTDRDYFHDLLFGVTNIAVELDEQMQPWLTRGTDEVDPVERAVLRLALFELRERLDVPYRVVISEAVALAKKFGAEQGHTFVNGVLDQAARTLRSIEISS